MYDSGMGILDFPETSRAEHERSSAGRLSGSRFFAGSTGVFHRPAVPNTILKTKIPLRHRQLVGRLADQKLAVGLNVIGLGIDFDMSDKRVSIMPNGSPSGETLAKAILSSFGRALKDFDDFWHAGWDRPAHERACVAKVAADVTSQFSQAIEPKSTGPGAQASSSRSL
jgi:hypothetical protein